MWSESFSYSQRTLRINLIFTLVVSIVIPSHKMAAKKGWCDLRGKECLFFRIICLALSCDFFFQIAHKMKEPINLNKIFKSPPRFDCCWTLIYLSKLVAIIFVGNAHIEKIACEIKPTHRKLSYTFAHNFPFGVSTRFHCYLLYANFI